MLKVRGSEGFCEWREDKKEGGNGILGLEEGRKYRREGERNEQV